MKENRFNFVTTFHAKHDHGKEMVKSWLKNVDHKKTNAVLNVYYEGNPYELAEEVGWTDIESANKHNGFFDIEKYYTDMNILKRFLNHIKINLCLLKLIVILMINN